MNTENNNKKLSQYALLTICGELIKAIDNCTDWFVLSRCETNPIKRAVYKAVYEEKNKEYLKILEETHEKLTR